MTSSCRRGSISLLLGAGFSAPMGYPIGGKMNDKMQHLDVNSFWFDNAGKLKVYDKDAPAEDRGKTGNNDYQESFRLCLALIKEYASVPDRNFDYEKFYDFIYTDKAKNLCFSKLLEPLNAEPEKCECYLDSVPSIYNQLVDYCLKDRNGNSWYDKKADQEEPISIYSGFLNCLSALCETTEINVHTLNHDLLFDSFNNYGHLKDKISDGFCECGSPFYGELKCNESSYICRLPRFFGVYDSAVRLYKLHGSLDYVPFYRTREGYEKEFMCYVKRRREIGVSEIKRDCGLWKGYEDSQFQQHPDCLTGSTVKVLRYKEPFFNNLLCHFEENLMQADKLIIIGYGFKDDGINNIIMRSFDYEHKHVYIVDNHAPKDGLVAKFAKKLNAHWLKVEIEGINEKTF